MSRRRTTSPDIPAWVVTGIWSISPETSKRLYLPTLSSSATGHNTSLPISFSSSRAVRALAHAAVPPFVLNVTGPGTLKVRDLALGLGKRLGVRPVFTGREASTALLSDASRCLELFGPPTVPVETLLDWVAEWVRHGGRSLARPTHFEEREGRF